LSLSSTSSREGSNTNPAGEPKILVGSSRSKIQIDTRKIMNRNRLFALRKAIKEGYKRRRQLNFSTISSTRSRVTVSNLQRQYERNEPIVTVTAYDAPMAALADSHADVILVGDSVGMVMLGHTSTIPVTMNAMTLFCAAAARGTRRALLVGDLPFGSYATDDIARINAVRLVQEGGAAAVKLEGGRSQSTKIKAILNEGIPVMGHVGLLPQTSPLSSGGSYVVQGRSGSSALSCVFDALAAQDAGAFAVVLEVVPAQVSAFITNLLTVPTIGIGAGPFCSGQVLVAHDILGFSPHSITTSNASTNNISGSSSSSSLYGSSSNYAPIRQPRFVRRYASIGTEIDLAFRNFSKDVRNKSFPASASSISVPLSVSNNSFETHYNKENHIYSNHQPIAQNEYFDMELSTVQEFQKLVLKEFPKALKAHNALEIAVDELKIRLGVKSLGFVPAFSALNVSISKKGQEDQKEKCSTDTSVITKTLTDSSVNMKSSTSMSNNSPISTCISQLSVAVLGSGAIASIMCSALGMNKSIKRLAMFSSWKERLNDIQRHGGIRFRKSFSQNSDIETVCGSLELYDINNNESKDFASLHGRFDLVLLCGKAYQVESQASLATKLVKPKVGLVVPLYNGAYTLEYVRSIFQKNESQSNDIYQDQVLYGQTSLGARYELDNSGWILEHTGHGQTFIFSSSSSSTTTSIQKNIAESHLLLSAMKVGPGDGLGAWPLQIILKPHSELELARWRKVAVNSILNPICALLGITNGGFEEAARGLYKKQVSALAAEAAQAIEVNCQGTSVSAQEILELVISISKKTSFNTNSLLADMQKGRDVEVPFINGAIVKSLGYEENGKAFAPVNMSIIAALDARTVALFGKEQAEKYSSRAIRIISQGLTHMR
jgi:3-methyl-2-oxobutanoate hydroxymethyltransferase